MVSTFNEINGKEVDNIDKNNDSVMLYQGDCVETMKTLPDNSVDSIVTDPPYELGFMNKDWDSTGIANNVEMWKECLRVLKPGGHLLSFGGTRTYHRMACAIEDAGFEVRDQMQWLYGSGWPKGQNIGKAIDKLIGNERMVVGKSRRHDSREFGGDIYGRCMGGIPDETIGTSEWEGWNTQLKPSHEPICLAQKPIDEKTIVKNILKWGTGGLNIDACRVSTNPCVDDMLREVTRGKRVAETWEDGSGFKNENNHLTGVRESGRFPANIILDEKAGHLLDVQSGVTSKTGVRTDDSKDRFTYASPLPNSGKTNKKETEYPGDTGGASRFFYCPKTSKRERNAGLDGMDKKTAGSLNFRNPSASGRSEDAPSIAAMGGLTKAQENFHPTVKPVKLMEYLIKLITPPNRVVFDPFMGSGSTGIAARKLGFGFIGIEKEKEYFEIAQKRIAFVSDEKQLNMLDAVSNMDLVIGGNE